MKQIPRFPNYSITEDGRVWSNRYRRWLKPQKRGKHVRLYVELGYRNKCAIHRLVLETYVGPCPEGMECRHIDGNPFDNRLGKLKWGTRSENCQDALRHGTCCAKERCGEKSPASKLSDEDRRLIIYQYATGLFTQRELGMLYAVHQAAIQRLVTGKCWPFIDTRKLKLMLEEVT